MTYWLKAIFSLASLKNGSCDYLYVVVPGWSAIQKIRVQYDSIPTDLLSKMQNGLERLHAKVNIGAESDEDLYFDWELTS